MAWGEKTQTELTDHDLQIIDEIVGGRCDALKELLDGATPHILPLLEQDVAALEPTVERIRAMRLAR